MMLLRPAAGFLVLFLGSLAASQITLAAEAGSFAIWLRDFRQEAASQGISRATLDAALSNLSPNPRVIELDHRQPEFTQTFWGYLDQRVNGLRIERGRQLLKKHRVILKTVHRKYGVQPRFLIAFWALESNFGDYTGKMSVVRSLATLAFDPRRGGYFRKELLAVLRIVDRGDMAANVGGSWAGAMGQTQFMPSTYLKYAVDQDGDGRRDLWKSLPDIFASSSNFLASAGWEPNRTWGREVRLPGGFDFGVAGMSNRKPLGAWQKLGLRRADGRDLPAVDIDASLILPGGFKGPAFLVYRNFRTIMAWNRSVLYALAVGHLADRIAGNGPLASQRPANDQPLSRGQVLNLQRMLAAKGFDVGSPDGVIGPRSRAAIKAFQRQAGLPADGYASPALLEEVGKTQRP